MGIAGRAGGVKGGGHEKVFYIKGAIEAPEH